MPCFLLCHPPAEAEVVEAAAYLAVAAAVGAADVAAAASLSVHGLALSVPVPLVELAVPKL